MNDNLSNDMAKADNLLNSYFSNPLNVLSRSSFFSFNRPYTNEVFYETFGYPTDLTIDDFRFMYERQDIAKRIVDSYPNATWPDGAKVFINDDDDTEDKFSKSFNEFAYKIDLYPILNRLDKLCRLGRFAILLIGTKGQLDRPLPRLKSFDEVYYLTPYSESNVSISEYEKNPANPRYGMPTMYKINVSNGISEHNTIDVHYSNILHVAENYLDSSLYGVPCLSSVYNRLLDLQKVCGGSAETFYNNGRGAVAFLSRDNKPIDSKELSKEINGWIHHRQKIIALSNVDAQPIEFRVASPESHVNKLIDLISAGSSIPKRILTGSERGELASSQDEANWSARVEERRRNHCETNILKPLIEIFKNSFSEESKQSYKIVWQPMFTLSELEKSKIGYFNSLSLQSYFKAGKIIPIKTFIEKFLMMKLNKKEIAAIEKIELKKEKEAQERMKGFKEKGIGDPNAPPKEPVESSKQ